MAATTSESDQLARLNANRLTVANLILQRHYQEYLLREGDAHRSDLFHTVAVYLDKDFRQDATEVEVLSLLGIPDYGFSRDTSKSYLYLYWRKDTGTQSVIIVHIENGIFENMGYTGASAMDLTRFKRYQTWSDVLGRAN